MAVFPVLKHKCLMALFKIQCFQQVFGKLLSKWAYDLNKNGVGKGCRWKQNRNKHLGYVTQKSYSEKCSHTVGRAHSSPIAKTNFANGLKVAGSSPAYLPVLSGPSLK